MEADGEERRTAEGVRREPARRRGTTGTTDPESTWNRRQVEWVGAGYDLILSSLPEAESTPISNRQGHQHPLEADVRLRWPSGGLFTTPARREWNGASIGSGRAWPPRPTQPAAVARALARTLQESRIAPPERWEAAITELGEWWSLRGCWPLASGQRTPALDRCVAVEHDVRWGRVWITATLRRPNGSQIVATHEGADLTGPLLTGRRTTHTLLQAVWEATDALAATLRSWRNRPTSARTLAEWVERVIGARWGPETGARILMRNAVTEAAGAETGAAAGTVSDDIETVAWTLGSAILGIGDVDERRRMAEGIVDAAAELAGWNESDTLAAEGAAGRGMPPQVH